MWSPIPSEFWILICFQLKFKTSVETTQKNKDDIVAEDQSLLGGLINATAQVLKELIDAKKMAHNISAFAEENKAPDIFRTHILHVSPFLGIHY